MDPVTHVDASALVAGWLRDTLPGYGVTGPVATDVPNPRPATFTTVERLGGVARNLVTDAPMLDIRRWSGNKHAAMADLQVIRSLLVALPRAAGTIDGHPVYRVVEIQGPASQADPRTGVTQATWVAEVWIRGATT